MPKVLLSFLLLLVLLLGALPGRAEEEPLDDSADGEVPFAEQIEKAIDHGVAWLRSKPTIIRSGDLQMAHWGLIRGQQLYGGGQGQGYGHPVGCTALALYTLLKCGVDPESEVIKQGFSWLFDEHTITTEYDDVNGSAVGWKWSYRIAHSSYELSAEILALAAKYDAYKRTKNTKLRRRRGKLVIKDKADKAWLTDMVDALVALRGVPNPASPPAERRGWRYNNKGLTLKRGRQTINWPDSPAPPHANQDLSSTQLAALALFSAHQFGIKVPEEVWADIGLFTLAQQEPDGPAHQRHSPGYRPEGEGPPVDKARGFMYIKGSPDQVEGIATGSMTACGVANLLMVRDVLTESKRGKKVWEEMGFDRTIGPAILDGLAWMDLNWSSFSNPKRGGYHIYYLYAIERAMDLLGKKLVGKHVWYNEGAKELLGRQHPVKVKGANGSETDGTFWDTESTHEPTDVLDTCFALLFLKRATKDLGVPVTAGDHGGPVDNR